MEKKNVALTIFFDIMSKKLDLMFHGSMLPDHHNRALSTCLMSEI